MRLQTKTGQMRALNRMFPECVDHHHRGRKLALWVFVPITIKRIAIVLYSRMGLDPVFLCLLTHCA